jgi:ribonuclease G
MTKEMIISSSAHETRVAILEDDQVAEIFIERERFARSGGQPVQGPGIQGATRHAVGVR